MPQHEARQGENWRKRPSFHRAVEMKQPHAMIQSLGRSSKRWMSRRGMGPPFLSWLCHSIWLLHLYNIVKIQTFSQSFPLTEFIAKAFCRLFLWNFKEKSINRFLWHSPSRKQASTIFYGTAFPIGRLPCRKGAKVAGTPLFLAVPQEAAESVSLEAPKR